MVHASYLSREGSGDVLATGSQNLLGASVTSAADLYCGADCPKLVLNEVNVTDYDIVRVGLRFSKDGMEWDVSTFIED